MEKIDPKLSCYSVVSDSLQPRGRQHARLPVLYYLPEVTQTQVHGISDAIQPSHPLSPPSALALHLSQHQGLFQWVGSSHQVTKVLELLFQHQSFQWIFRTDFQDWLLRSCCQATLKSLLQQHSSKASILWCSALFMVQLLHPHMSTKKTIALNIWTFISKVMSLFFNTFSRFVIAFLPRSKLLLISWQ